MVYIFWFRKPHDVLERIQLDVGACGLGDRRDEDEKKDIADLIFKSTAIPGPFLIKGLSVTFRDGNRC